MLFRSVFGGSSWEIDKMKFIRDELKELQNSAYLEQSSPVGTSFKTIRDILAKYDEVVGFINASNNYSYSYYGLSDRFPDVSDKVQKSRKYYANTGNIYVNNCTRLKDNLSKIPQTLFSKHIDYLHSKISKYAYTYKDYKDRGQVEYNEEIYKPLSMEINELNNDIYNVSNFDNKKREIRQLLNYINDNDVYNFFFN